MVVMVVVEGVEMMVASLLSFLMAAGVYLNFLYVLNQVCVYFFYFEREGFSSWWMDEE